jgi:hypothetical protein
VSGSWDGEDERVRLLDAAADGADDELGGVDLLDARSKRKGISIGIGPAAARPERTAEYDVDPGEVC